MIAKGINNETGQALPILVDKQGRVILAPESIRQIIHQVIKIVRDRKFYSIEEEDGDSS